MPYAASPWLDFDVPSNRWTQGRSPLFFPNGKASRRGAADAMPCWRWWGSSRVALSSHRRSRPRSFPPDSKATGAGTSMRCAPRGGSGGRGIEPVGANDGRIALYRAEHEPLLARPAVAVEGAIADALRELLARRGAVFFGDIARALGGFPGDVLDAL